MPHPKSKITIHLSPLQLQSFKALSKKLDANNSSTLAYLLEAYEGNNLKYIKNFRYNLVKRVRLGINKMYLDELIKLRDYLDSLINKIT